MINDFLGIAIVGAIVSALIEWVTRKWGTTSLASKAVAIVISIIVGGFYTYFSGTVWWTTIIGVLAAASTVWALFIPKQ
jgi:biotin transporter BioY